MQKKQLEDDLELFAHKVKNPLHAIVLNMDVLKSRLQKQNIDKSSLKHLDCAMQDMQKMNAIILRFIEYIKMDETDQKKIDLRSFLKG